MTDFDELDKNLSKYFSELKTWSPDRLVHINLETLQHLDLLDYFHDQTPVDSFTQYFQVAETADKITLVSDEFIIWIVPELTDGIPVTYTFIAINEDGTPRLELSFVSKGVYNHSKLVMRVLEKFLHEIKENEDLLSRYKDNH